MQDDLGHAFELLVDLGGGDRLLEEDLVDPIVGDDIVRDELGVTSYASVGCDAGMAAKPIAPVAATTNIAASMSGC
ncbi:hypothetical protein ACFSTI_05890 [Rhizorhabdus histidinilytica]